MSSPSDDVLVRIDDLSVGPHGDRVLDSLSLDVHRGERLGIVAAGEETAALSSALLGEPEGDPVSGTVTVFPEDGEPIDVLGLRKRERRRYRWRVASLVMEDAANSFNPTTTIRRHVEETLGAHGRSTDSGTERAKRLLSALDLDPDRVLDARPDELSRDARDRAAIASSLLLEPDLVVFETLPAVLGRRDESYLDALQAEGEFAAVVLETDLSGVASFADRLAIVHEGRVVETGETEAILDRPSHAQTKRLVEFFDGPPSG